MTVTKLIATCLCALGISASAQGQDVHYDTCSRCDNLLRQGALLQNDGQWEPSYDSLALFLQICSYDSNSQIGAQPWRAFVTINGSASALLSQRGFGVKYLAFLKQVLYNNPDTLWYCNDVLQMLTAEQSNEAEQLAELKYIIDSRKCQGFTDWQTYYNAASHWMHQAWLDSIVLDYERDSIYGGYQWWVDSMVNKDTLTNPYDSTIPSLEQEDLQILLGPQNIVQGPSSPVASQALMGARLLDNPVSDEIGISFTMGREALVTMELRDILGRSIPITYAKYQLEQAGEHKAFIPEPNLPPGTYYLRISTDDGDVITLKIVKE